MQFFILLFCVFVVQLAAAVVAFQYQDHLKSYVERSMYDVIYNKYDKEKRYDAVIDALQENVSALANCCFSFAHRTSAKCYSWSAAVCTSTRTGCTPTSPPRSRETMST